MYRYIRHKDGGYRLIDEASGDLLFSIGPPPTVGIGFSWDGCRSVLHKHGSPDRVKKWLQDTSATYQSAGLTSDSYAIVGDFDAEELNLLLGITGRLDLFIKGHGLDSVIRDNPDRRTFYLINKDGWTGWEPEKNP